MGCYNTPHICAKIIDLPVEKYPLPWLLIERLYTRKFYAHPELLKSRVLVNMERLVRR